MIWRAVVTVIALSACTQGQPDRPDQQSQPDRLNESDIAQLRAECRADGAMPEMRACASLDLAFEQRRMDAYLAAAIRREDRIEDDAHRSEKLDEIAHTQALWRAYAEGRCEPSEREIADGGTIPSLDVTGCWTLATRQRTRDIWADYLTFQDTTPPIYPEPLEQAPDVLPEASWPY